MNKNTVIKSLVFKYLERTGHQGIAFVVNIILARLLAPSDYGVLAILTIFITISQVFVQSGLNTALIQKKDADETDFSSVFYLSLTIAIGMYIVLFITSPLIARFYEMPELPHFMRIISLILIPGVLNSIQNAKIARNMEFRKLLYSSLGSVIVSGIAGITMAYMGFGVWALVVQQLSNQICNCVIMWFTVRWRPQLLFSGAKAKSLFSFGWKLMVSSLLNAVYANISSLVIGKLYTPDILGYFKRGQQYPQLLVDNANGTIQTVMLPVLSSQQDNRSRVKDMMRRAIVTSSFIIFPMMVGLAVTAEPLVKILLTDTWLPCVPFLQIYCAIYALMPIHTANLQAINALGRSDLFLKLEIIKKCYGLAVLGLTVFYGVYAIALGGIITGLISTVVNAYPNKKLLNYSYVEQWKDIIPSLLLSMIMGTVVYSIKWLGLSVLSTLIVQICSGVILYVGLAWIFKLECLRYLLSTLKDIFISRNGETV